MIRICVPESEAQLAVIRSLFEAEGIEFFVKNDHFGTTFTGPQIDNYNAKTVWVAEPFEARARVLVAELQSAPTEPRRKSGIWDRLRMVLEVVLFSWFVPGRRRSKNPTSGTEDE